MVHYELVKVSIDALDLAEIILEVVVIQYDLLDSIMSDWGSVFTS